MQNKANGNGGEISFDLRGSRKFWIIVVGAITTIVVTWLTLRYEYQVERERRINAPTHNFDQRDLEPD